MRSRAVTIGDVDRESEAGQVRNERHAPWQDLTPTMTPTQDELDQAMNAKVDGAFASRPESAHHPRAIYVLA